MTLKEPYPRHLKKKTKKHVQHATLSLITKTYLSKLGQLNAIRIYGVRLGVDNDILTRDNRCSGDLLFYIHRNLNQEVKRAMRVDIHVVSPNAAAERSFGKTMLHYKSDCLHICMKDIIN